MNIQGVTALVVGGASGLGEGTAKLLAHRGANVVILDLERQRGRVDESKVRFVAGDITKSADIQAAIDVAAEGDFRICVNCAGIPTRLWTLDTEGQPADLELFRRVIDVNLVGSFDVIRLVAAAFAKNDPVDGERGVIVSTSSIGATDGMAGMVSYSASKGAIDGMMLPIARDLRKYQIRTVAIAPGLFETPFGESPELEKAPPPPPAAPEGQPPDIFIHPERAGTPAEFAGLAALIVENAFINGTTYRIDGAQRLPPG